MTDAISILERAEADNHALLYKCRWNADTAADIVPKIIACLGHTDGEVLRRSLSALHRIGLPAGEATPHVIPLIWHSDDLVARTATIALAAVGRKRPLEAVPALVAASKQLHLQKDAMFGLIAMGKDAREGSSVFAEVILSPDHRMRRLALRGLEATASAAELRASLEIVRNDRSKIVREYARKIESRNLNAQDAP